MGYPPDMDGASRIPLPPRLHAVAELIPAGWKVADVGTDHGLLPLHLRRRERASACIATDRDTAALARARRAAEGVAGLDFRPGEGLGALHPDDRCDVIVVAGLGGAAIARILAPPALAPLAPRRLVLQPQTEPALLRRHLAAAGWIVVDERMVEDRGRFYVAIAAERGGTPPPPPPPGLSPEDVLEAGPLILSTGGETPVRYWRARLDRLEAVLRSRPRGPGARAARDGAERARRVLRHLEGVTSGRGGRTPPSADPPGSARRSR